MRGPPSCPRCAAVLHALGVWDSAWSCPAHGGVPPLQPAVQPSADLAVHLATTSALPLWLPWPLPHGWVVTGLLLAGDHPTEAAATAVALSGPNPLGGAGDLLVVTEEPGVGLGARFAGLPGPDAGLLDTGAPAAKVTIGGHPTALWLAPRAVDCAAFVGEWAGRWLWAVLRPASAGALLAEDLVLSDLRELGPEVELLPYGALPPWLVAG